MHKLGIVSEIAFHSLTFTVHCFTVIRMFSL